jgi:predicted nuclease with TOPRIM domain
MPMQAESLEVLEKASVAPAQARAIVRAIEIEIAGAKDTLATKHDILALRHDFDVLRRDFDVLRRDFGVVRAELRGEVEKLRGETEKLRVEMEKLRGETEKLRGEMEKLRGELRAEIHRSVSGVTRQMYTAILGQMAVLLGFAYFFATNLR